MILEPWQADSAGRAGGACWRGRTVGSDDVDIFAFADFWSKLVALYSDNKLVEYGLVNEPHDMSTMAWWAIAQKCVDAIRAAGATTTIHVPGNGYTAASTWTETGYDTASPKRSNAYGWLNANGADHPLFDALGRCVAEVHVYFDPDGSGSSTAIAGPMVAKAAVATAAMEAAAHGYRVFVGEIGCFAGVPGATQAWSEFVAYIGQHPSTCAGSRGGPGQPWLLGRRRCRRWRTFLRDPDPNASRVRGHRQHDNDQNDLG